MSPLVANPDLPYYSANANYALYCSSKSGPTFGFNGNYKHLELFISSGSNANQKCKSNFGKLLKHPDYDCQIGRARYPCWISISSINHEHRSFKAKIEPSCADPDLPYYSANANYALYCSSKSGPTFGFNGYYKHLELFISSGSNANQKCKSNFERLFKHPDYDCQIERARYPCWISIFSSSLD